MKSKMRVRDYYVGKRILVSGATGLMGKALVEKLLRSCPGVSKIYVIIRTKKGVSPEERWKKTTDSPLFKYLREVDPESLKKCQVLPGESTADNFGLSEEHIKLIEENVNIVYHVAASISFEDDLVSAIKLNVKSSYSLLELGRRIQKLECFVHVSTAFSNFSRRGLVEEKVYNSHLGWRDMIDLAEDPKNFEHLCALQPKALSGHLSTYTLSKGLAENAVNDYREHFPIIINRPGLILGAFKDPIPGWMDVENFITLFGKCFRTGVLKVVLNDPNTVIQQIPLDMPIRALIVAPWKKYIQSEKQVEVLCCTLNSRKELTYDIFYRVGKEECLKLPTQNMIWHPFMIRTTNYHLYYLLFILLHFIPAVFLDGLLRISGRKPKLMKVYRAIWSFHKFCVYSLKHIYLFSTIEYQRLETCLLDVDKNDFSMDTSDYDPEVEVRNNINCLIGHLWKDKEDNSEKAREIAKRFKILHYAVCSVLALATVKVVYNIALCALC